MSSEFVIMARTAGGGNGMGETSKLASLGTRQQIVGALAHFNTGPEVPGGDMLYGPGINIELPPGQDEVNQMLMTVTEEEIAWQVIMRLAKSFGWKIVDPATGRELSP